MFTVCILAYMSWLPVTVWACADFLRHKWVLALIQYACVLDMLSHSTGYGLPQHMCVCWQFFIVRVCTVVMFSHSTCVCWQFCSTCVYWLWFPVSMCWDGLLQHDYRASNDSCISSVALCHPKYVCNEAYSYLIVNISYMLIVRGLVADYLTYLCEVGLLYVRQCKK